MLDPKGAILSHPLVASALAGLNVSDKRKLVYKKYRDANSAIDRMYGGVDGKKCIHGGGRGKYISHTVSVQTLS